MWRYEKTLSKPLAKKKWLKLSLETCELGLQDPDSQLVSGGARIHDVDRDRAGRGVGGAGGYGQPVHRLGVTG